MPNTQKNVVEAELIRYIKQYQGCNYLNTKICCYVYDSSSLAKEIIPEYVSIMKTCSNYLQSMKNVLPSTDSTVKCDETYVFIEKIEDSVDSASFLINSAFWDIKTRVHFIAYNPVPTGQVKYKVLKNIWYQQIYNFVFVIVDEAFEIISFNYFTRKKTTLLKTSRTFCKDLFPDKMKNMERATVRIALAEHYPYATWNEKNNSFMGPDVYLMTLFARITNCRLEVFNFRNISQSIDSLRRKEVDIVFTGLFQVRKDTKIFPNYFRTFNFNAYKQDLKNILWNYS